MSDSKILPTVIVGILKAGAGTRVCADPLEVFDVLRRGILAKKDIEDCRRVFKYREDAMRKRTLRKKTPKINRRLLDDGMISAKHCAIDGEDDYV